MIKKYKTTPNNNEKDFPLFLHQHRQFGGSSLYLQLSSRGAGRCE